MIRDEVQRMSAVMSISTYIKIYIDITTALLISLALLFEEIIQDKDGQRFEASSAIPSRPFVLEVALHVLRSFEEALPWCFVQDVNCGSGR